MVTASQAGVVYVNGKFVGNAGEPLTVDCGIKYIRLAEPGAAPGKPPTFVGHGRSAQDRLPEDDRGRAPGAAWARRPAARSRRRARAWRKPRSGSLTRSGQVVLGSADHGGRTDGRRSDGR